jgi:hypothetical protein
VPQPRDSSATLEKQTGASAHGAGGAGAGSRSLAVAPTGELCTPAPLVLLPATCHGPWGRDHCGTEIGTEATQQVALRF